MFHFKVGSKGLHQTPVANKLRSFYCDRLHCWEMLLDRRNGFPATCRLMTINIGIKLKCALVHLSRWIPCFCVVLTLKEHMLKRDGFFLDGLQRQGIQFVATAARPHQRLHISILFFLDKAHWTCWLRDCVSCTATVSGVRRSVTSQYFNSVKYRSMKWTILNANLLHSWPKRGPKVKALLLSDKIKLVAWNPLGFRRPLNCKSIFIPLWKPEHRVIKVSNTCERRFSKSAQTCM